MTLRDIDAWIGKTLFVPPIIWICQRTKQTQFAVSRLFWFIAAMDAFYRTTTWFASIFWGLLCIVMMLAGSLAADAPTRSVFGWRLFAFGFLVIDVLVGVLGADWSGIEFWLLVLTAEYASTIRTIPPTKNTKRARQTASRSV